MVRSSVVSMHFIMPARFSGFSFSPKLIIFLFPSRADEQFEIFAEVRSPSVRGSVEASTGCAWPPPIIGIPHANTWLQSPTERAETSSKRPILILITQHKYAHYAIVAITVIHLPDLVHRYTPAGHNARRTLTTHPNPYQFLPYGPHYHTCG